jgi:hypothetical protein
VLHEVEIPVLGVVEVGKPSFDQGADEVEGQRRSLVAAQQQLGIRPPLLLGNPGG